MDSNFFTKVRFWREEGLAVIAIDNTPKNYLDSDVFDQLSAAMALAEGDDGVKVICLTGAGKAFFSVGVNWREVSDAATYIEKAFSVVSVFRSVTKPTISLINAHAFGAGLELALLTDFRLISGYATLGFPESRFGFSSVLCGPLLAAELGGAWLSRRIFLLGEYFSAEAARNSGLADDVFPPGNFLGEAKSWANSLPADQRYLLPVRKVIHDLQKLAYMHELEKSLLVASEAAKPADIAALDVERERAGGILGTGKSSDKDARLSRAGGRGCAK